jgi:serine protease Do
MEIQPHLPPNAPDQSQREPRIPPKIGDNPQLPEFRFGIDRMRASFMDKRETSFAIPINEVNKVAKELIQYGQVQRGWLGIHIQRLLPEYRQAQPAPPSAQRGVLVEEVRPSSPADKAGIRKGDIILEFNGKPIYSPGDLQRLVSQQAPGNEVKIKFYRENKEQSITVKLGMFPKD